jgi:uncharacterized protein (DUF1501 family)
MKRRSFIKHAAHSLAIPGFFGALNNQSFGQTIDRFLNLANETDRVLVLIYLEGGNDGLNTVIPLSYLSQLNQVRPHVIMPENKLLNIDSSDFALHPSLDGFKSLYEEGRLQVIHSVGYPQQSFSHFKSTDIWMSGSNSNELLPSGWTGRYLESNYPEFPNGYPNEDKPDPMAVEIGYGSSMLFQGERANFSMVINNPNSFYQILENAVEDTPDTVAGDKLRYIRLIAQQSQKYGMVVKRAAEKVTQQKVYPDTRLGNQLRIVSRLISGGLKTPLYLVRMGGFDTHDNQVDGADHTKGRHANLLKQLNDAVVAFMNDLEFQGSAERVMGMTFSEFGRRIVSNSSNGTDHGSSAPLFVFGNMSYGGSLGTAPKINGTEVYRDNIPLQYDFRQVYTSLLSQWFDAGDTSIQAATRGSFEQVPVIKNGLVTGIEELEPVNLTIYPNPTINIVTLKMDVVPGKFSVQVIDSSGRKTATIFEGLVNTYHFQQSFDLSQYPAGMYIFLITNGNKKFTRKLIKL